MQTQRAPNSCAQPPILILRNAAQEVMQLPGSFPRCVEELSVRHAKDRL